MGKLGDYPMATMEGVEPIFVRAMMIGAMAVRYVRCVPGMEYSDGHACAVATWDTDWEYDPAPRTFDAALEAVDSDLECWGD